MRRKTLYTALKNLTSKTSWKSQPLLLTTSTASIRCKCSLRRTHIWYLASHKHPAHSSDDQGRLRTEKVSDKRHPSNSDRGIIVHDLHQAARDSLITMRIGLVTEALYRQKTSRHLRRRRGKALSTRPAERSKHSEYHGDNVTCSANTIKQCAQQEGGTWPGLESK